MLYKKLFKLPLKYHKYFFINFFYFLYKKIKLPLKYPKQKS